MQKKEKYKKKDGYILFIVIIITIILVSVTMAVTMISTSHSRDITKDIKKEKAYYISNAALEIIYATLNSKDSSGVKIIESAGTGNFNATKEKVITKNGLKIKNQSGEILGYADVYVDLDKTPAPDQVWYFRIVSKGMINDKDDPDNPSDTHVLTMFIFKNDINNPKIYEGDKKTI